MPELRDNYREDSQSAHCAKAMVVDFAGKALAKPRQCPGTSPFLLMGLDGRTTRARSFLLCAS
jgi:hypothetical protein